MCAELFVWDLQDLRQALVANGDAPVLFHAFGLFLAQNDGVSCKCGIENFRGLPCFYRLCNFANFCLERFQRIATGQFGFERLATVVEQRWRARVFPFTPDHGKVEHERGLLQVNFETMFEGPSLLEDGSARCFNQQIAVFKFQKTSARTRQGYDACGPA